MDYEAVIREKRRELQGLQQEIARVQELRDLETSIEDAKRNLEELKLDSIPLPEENKATSYGGAAFGFLRNMTTFSSGGGGGYTKVVSEPYVGTTRKVVASTENDEAIARTLQHDLNGDDPNKDIRRDGDQEYDDLLAALKLDHELNGDKPPPKTITCADINRMMS